MKKQRPVTTGDISTKLNCYFDNGTKRSQYSEKLIYGNKLKIKEISHYNITG